MDGTLRLQEKSYLLKEIPLFATLSKEDKRLIAESSMIVEYKKGEVVYKEGDAADAFYCVITGRLRAYIMGKRGVLQCLEYLGRGKYFGIISILTGEPHSVSVEAINDSIILKIAKDNFNRILKRIPELAIHFGTTLSRRLKRKDIHEKRIFESTIISIFGTAKGTGATTYAYNLGVGLKAQTARKIIMVQVGSTGQSLKSPFLNSEFIKNTIERDTDGIDLIKVKHRGEESMEVISLLSYLTNDYHYIIVDTPSFIGKVTFEILKQSDMVHLVTVLDAAKLHLTSQLISELEKTTPMIGSKIKIIASEYGSTKNLDYSKSREILRYDIYATLPDISVLTAETDKKRFFTITDNLECEYSMAIRRISREIGDCLVGLALGSGAALGLAHIGILKVLEKEKIPIDIVVGTSIGALVGGLWASGMEARKIEDLALRFKRKIDTYRLFDLTIPKTGLIKGREIKKFLYSQFGDMTFYDLKMPFKAISCDIEKRDEVVIDKGSVVDAVMASIATPGIFQPIRKDGMLLVDGGIINPLPTNVLMRLGVSKIIAVNTLPSPDDLKKSKRKVVNIFDVIVNSVQAGEFLLAEISCQNTDVAIHPVLPSVDWYEFYEGERLIRRGEEEAQKFLPQLKGLSIQAC